MNTRDDESAGENVFRAFSKKDEMCVLFLFICEDLVEKIRVQLSL